MLRLFAAAVVAAVIGCGGHAPSSPFVHGRQQCRPNDTVWFEVVSYDAEDDSISYLLAWGDGSESGWGAWMATGDEYRVSHSYGDTGEYPVLAKAKDKGRESGWSDSLRIEVRYFGPSAPHRPSGRDTVVIFDSVPFVSSAGHPLGQGERVTIRFDWDDGDTSDWSDFVRPDSLVIARHAFVRGGRLAVRAQAKDSFEYLSGWSEPDSVVVIDSFALRP